MLSAKILVLILVVLFLADRGCSWRRRRRRRRRAPCVRRDCTWRKEACSVTCGNGFYHYAQTGIKACGGTCNKPTTPCFLAQCPVPCQLYSWGAWSSCSNTCGQKGIQTRTRLVKVAPQHGAPACPSTRETKQCTGRKEHCSWKRLGCSATCGAGREMYKLTSANRCGLCSMPRRSCVGWRCPVDCKVSPWRRWTPCRYRKRMQFRTRTIIVQPKFGGKRCPTLQQARRCKGCCKPKRCTVKYGRCVKFYRGMYFRFPKVVGRSLQTAKCRLPKPKPCKRPPRRGDTRAEATDNEKVTDDGSQRLEEISTHGQISMQNTQNKDQEEDGNFSSAVFPLEDDNTDRK